MRQIAALHLAPMAREGKTRLSAAAIAALVLGDPAGFVGDAAVSLAVRLLRAGSSFTRGRQPRDADAGVSTPGPPRVFSPG